MTVLCFLDTETTSLRPDRRAWEVALIRRDDHGDQEDRWLVAADDLDLGNADLAGLRIGGFHDRHPAYSDAETATGRAVSEWAMLHEVEALTRDAHIIGAVPSFDTETLTARMRAHGICPSWHYHLIDVEALAVGFIHGRRASKDDPERETVLPSWKSDDLSRACGVEPPSKNERHTALADAHWVMRLYDAITLHARFA